MESLASAAEYFVLALRLHVVLVVQIIAVIWLINVLNWFLFRGRLNQFGIYPRRAHGLPGILVSPILHGNFNHLFFNTIPLFLLLSFILVLGMTKFYCITAIIVVGSGIVVWLLGRKAYHIGASGVIMGYWGFLLVHAYQQPTALSLIIAIVTLYYLGGLVFNLLPSGVRVSWEAHIAGFAAGVAASFIC